MLNIATSVWLFQYCRVIYKTNTAFIKRPAIFQKTARIFVQTAKFPPIISRK